MKHRAYSLLDVKSVEEEHRIIRGVATTPTPDRLGDIVEPLGVAFAADLPLLHQHDSRRPVGRVKFDKPSRDGITFEASLPRIEEPASLKERIDTAWSEIKAGLIRGVSIGFRGIEVEPLNVKDPYGPQRFVKSEVLELSLVTVPANADAQISLIKSLDLAALGNGSTEAKTPAGVTASPKPVVKVKTMEHLTESIARYQNELVTKSEQRDALLNDANKEGRTLDAAEDEKFETLDGEIKSLVKHLDRLKDVEKTKATTARPVAAAAETKQWDAARPFAVVKTAPELEPGIRFARYARLKALARIDQTDVERLAQRAYPDDSALLQMLTRAAVAAGTATGTTYAAPLVNPLGFADFLEFLRPQTIIGKFGAGGVPGFSRIPFRVPVITQTTGGAAYWVGEGKPKPLTKFDWTRVTLEPLKVANIAVATMELLRDSSPSAEALIRDGLAAAIRERLDIDFINPAKAAAAGISPASITNGVTALPSSGVDADSVRADLAALINQFSSAPANNPPSSGVLVMNSAAAVQLSLMVNPLGQPEFSSVNRAGGALLGFPIVVSDYVPSGTVVMINAGDIYLADEGGIDVAMSDEASLQMDDAPTNDSVTPTPTTVVSMFQTNSVAFRAERTINWMRKRTQSVSLLSGVDWGGSP